MCYQNCLSENSHGSCAHSAPGPRPCAMEEAFAEAEARAAGVETDIICPHCLAEAGDHFRLRWLDHGEYVCSEPACGQSYTPAELAHALSTVAMECHAQANNDASLYDELTSLREFRRAVQKSLASTGTAA